MSSRWSLPWGVQKPPAVCKKPPVPTALPPLPFDQKEFQATVQWYEPAYGSPLQLSGPLPILPNPPALQHVGWLSAQPYALRLRMTQNPALPQLAFDLRLYLNSAPIGYKSIVLDSPKSLDPFDSGLLQFPVVSPSDLVTARVWS